MARSIGIAVGPGSDVLYLGMDFGTSGARAMVINEQQELVADARQVYGAEASSGWTGAWERSLGELLGKLPPKVRQAIASIAIDGTSATSLLLDRQTGQVLAPAKLYNESQGGAIVKLAQAIAPASHTATASTSTFCKLLTWHDQGIWQEAQQQGHQPVLQHQADWLASLLHGRRTTTDYNNALKLGYNPGADCYPGWLSSQPFAGLLPAEVFAPGDPVAPVTPEAAERLGLPPHCLVCAGTTDSIAAFLAAGATEIGEAVSSLGSTLAIKLLSESRVDDAKYGVYSHRLGHTWLVGGASNTGGAVLRQHFSDAQLLELTPHIDPSQPSGLDYYPLTAKGERFPINDPDLPPCLEPRPEDDARFLHGILEGIAHVEAQAYRLLLEMGASPLTKVYTAGGGAKNPVWTAIRARQLGVPVVPSPQAEAAFGSALLARQGYHKSLR
ncbi:hypothetical protein WJX72_011497 [[Myrmecia] bisecta]|uniref:D-ribulose kinase n=1 Tax=[Myrmecia] bisecta TaxID=41462 RepID=A0AAW1P8V7_9CHLO